jgi:RNA-directed DNA polymerase
MFNRNNRTNDHITIASRRTRLLSWSFQRKLYQKSKQEETFRFYVLYDKLCLPYVLREAYKRCRKNGGSPGVDGVTFASIEDAGVDGFLERIRNELEQETYRPEMVVV